MAPTILKRSVPWDVIVIGSGAAGGWAAHELGRRHLKVLVLEAGPDVTDLPRDLPERWLTMKRYFDRGTRRRRTQSRHQAYWEIDPDLFVVDTENPYETPPGKDFQWIRTRALNGRLLSWGGVGVRTSDYEFRAPEQDGFGAPWPFGYAELERYYDDVDAFWPVYGQKDGLPQLPDGNYVGAVRLTDAEQRLIRSAKDKLGRTLIPARGVLVRPQSIRRGERPQLSPVRAAMRKFGVNLRANAVVSHILLDDEGRASGVAFVDRQSKQAHEVRARTVVVCASAIESARILLNSRSRQHPDGLGNSSGTLGRYLMDHPGVHVGGYMPGRRDDVWKDGYGGPKNIMMPRYHNLENRAALPFLRGWGAFGVAGRFRANKDQCGPDEVSVSLVALGEMLPRFENRVTLHPHRKDPWGVPIPVIDCSFTDNERALQKAMIESLRELIHAAGGRDVEPTTVMAPGGFVHEMGTARMGTSSKTSVLNGHAQCWDVPNVFVMDGAAWPSGAWQNPTFTMMAIAGRGCEHLFEELKQGRI